MAISIFWRLVLSHIGILVLSGAACLYSIVQLGSLSGTARAALGNNHRMIDYQEALTDAFLSEVRYGGKYLITHTEGRHDQLRQFKKDFTDYLELLKARAEPEPVTISLTRIERFHRQYHDLYDREVEYIRAKQIYASSRYQQERDKIIESTIRELDGLKAQLRAKLQEKLEGIDQGARRARKIAVISTLIVLIMGTLLSLKVSQSITDPLGETIASLPRNQTDWLRAPMSWGMNFVERSQNFAKIRKKRLMTVALGLAAAWNRRSTD
jgi:hypothetical protein